MAMATFIDNARRQMEKGVRKRSAAERYRIYYHLLAAIGLLFVADHDYCRALIVASSIVLEIGLHFLPKYSRFVLNRPKSFHAFWAIFQLFSIIVLQWYLHPAKIRMTGMMRMIPGFPAGTSGDPRVLVGPNGVVPLPYDVNVGSFITHAAQSAMSPGKPYVTGDDFSIIIVVRDEDKYIAKTIQFTYDTTPKENLKEFIIVDDYSANPVAELLDKQLPSHIRRLVRVVRFDTKEGLIRARTLGANMAEASNIFFLDGHCKPKPGWLPPLLIHLKANYKRVACPVVEAIKESNWEDVGTSGFKMMFEWTFEFGWYDDLTDEVPLSAGGILAMTKKWWSESGEYDKGMLEWGGENLEQSMRVWLCGGEIYVVRNSFVGHIFDRPPKPNPENKLVTQVQKNQKRGALVWLDDYYQFFERFHSVVKTLDEGPGLEERHALRQKLRCKPFQWYVNKFRSAFERKGLLVDYFHNIRHVRSRMCLTAVAGDSKAPKDSPLSTAHVTLEPCLANDNRQQWQTVAGNRMIYTRNDLLCLKRSQLRPLGGFLDKNTFAPVLAECDWNEVFKANNNEQFWQFDAITNHRIFNYGTDAYKTLTGNDPFFVDTTKDVSPSSYCLSSSLSYWTIGEQSADPQNPVKQPWSLKQGDVVIVPCNERAGSLDWMDKQSWEWMW